MVDISLYPSPSPPNAWRQELMMTMMTVQTMHPNNVGVVLWSELLKQWRYKTDPIVSKRWLL